jgi:hypothetical protein
MVAWLATNAALDCPSYVFSPEKTALTSDQARWISGSGFRFFDQFGEERQSTPIGGQGPFEAITRKATDWSTVQAKDRSFGNPAFK